MTVGPVGTRTRTGTQARPPAAAGEACSLPWKLAEGEQSGELGVQPQQHGRDASPAPARAASSRPLFLESPQSPRAAQAPPGEMRTGGL